jgi:hypothetical protein
MSEAFQAGDGTLTHAAKEADDLMTSRHILEKWMHCEVAAGRQPSVQTVEDFERVLGDATDERPLQTLLASLPVLLAPLAQLGGRIWCLDRPRLGSEFVPDFLLASTTSVGFQWTMVELESPVERALTRAGLPAKKLAEALKQIRDWRMWLTENVAYARSELGLKDIDSTCRAFVVIGRRNGIDSTQIKTYRALSTDGVIVMSYDRLLENMNQAARGRQALHG